MDIEKLLQVHAAQALSQEATMLRKLRATLQHYQAEAPELQEMEQRLASLPDPDAHAAKPLVDAVLAVLECFRRHRHESAVVKHIYNVLKEDLFNGNRVRRPEIQGPYYLTEEQLQQMLAGREPLLARLFRLVG